MIQFLAKTVVVFACIRKIHGISSCITILEHKFYT